MIICIMVYIKCATVGSKPNKSIDNFEYRTTIDFNSLKVLLSNIIDVLFSKQYTSIEFERYKISITRMDDTFIIAMKCEKMSPMYEKLLLSLVDIIISKKGKVLLCDKKYRNKSFITKMLEKISGILNNSNNKQHIEDVKDNIVVSGNFSINAYDAEIISSSEPLYCEYKMMQNGLIVNNYNLLDKNATNILCEKNYRFILSYKCGSSNIEIEICTIYENDKRFAIIKIPEYHYLVMQIVSQLIGEYKRDNCTILVLISADGGEKQMGLLKHIFRIGCVPHTVYEGEIIELSDIKNDTVVVYEGDNIGVRFNENQTIIDTRSIEYEECHEFVIENYIGDSNRPNTTPKNIHVKIHSTNI